MSTTFGIRNEETGATIEIARRSNGEIRFTDDLGYFLKDDVKVVALDNTAQGIHTIGDIKKAIEDAKWVMYEHRGVYDGWILMYNKYTKEIRWRDHFAVHRLSDEKKQEIEQFIKNSI